MTAAPDDIELLERWREGDSRSGEALFARHFKPLYRFFRSKVSHNVEDLVQDTLLACVKGRDRIRDDGSFRAYLFGIARRRLMVHYNKKANADVDFGTMSVMDVGPGAGSVIAKREEDRLILQALRMLPLDQQIAIELHDWEGLTGPEIAHVLELPEGTIRSRLRRGRIALREKLEELASSAERLQSTLTRLDDWANAIRELIDPDAPVRAQ